MRLFSDVASGVADPHLARAVRLAENARGCTAPNPLVGCVIVNGGRIVGEGYHPRAGEPHAEVFALAAAKEDARGAVTYITLEPCRHQGRTPPCTDALIAAGVASVHVGMLDPTDAAGGGLELLRQAGVEVSVSENDDPFRELNVGWLQRLKTGRPRVTVKVGLSLDGSLSLAPATRSSMTGASGSGVTMRLRSAVDAVMVGASTVASDDPVLTARDSAGSALEHQPLRVVLSRSQLPPADARVLTDHAAPTLVLAPSAAVDGAGRLLQGAEVAAYDSDRGVLGALETLGRHGLNDVLVEPGERLFGALWREDLIDELITVTAGGVAGRGSLRLFEGDEAHVDDALAARFTPIEAGIVGDVSVVVWRPRGAGQS